MTRALSRPLTSPTTVDPDTAPLVPELGQAAARSASSWTRRYVATLVGVDAASALAAVALGWVSRYGAPPNQLLTYYTLFSAVVMGGWLMALAIGGAYDLRTVGAGNKEFRDVLRAAVYVVGILAVAAFLIHLPVTRGFLAVSVPIGLGLQVLGRWSVRRIAVRRRAAGQWTRTILAVGNTESVRHLVEATHRNPRAGLRVVGACVEDTEVHDEVAPGVPVLGSIFDAAELAEQVDADVLAVAGSGLGPRSIRELGWALEGSGRHMVMAPGLTEVAGPRVHVSPVEGLPLMWVDQPQFVGLKRLTKRAMDLAGAGLLMLLLSPVFAGIAAAVRLTSKGPALYRSTRMGVDGEKILVYKFRSMFQGSDLVKAQLLEQNESEGGMLFKMRNDPRVTPVGRILRKLSLDELPQLLNVLNGSMSLVGPRPPLPDEVERYDGHTHRRLLVKPGMTGLWQVSGRSDLCWDEAVRLDLYYVENWSLALDVTILARTVWAVLRSRGAY